MKTNLSTIALAAALLSPQARAENELAEMHREIVKTLNEVHQHLPEPLRVFAETFPPLALPRQHTMQLAQLESADVAAPGQPVPPPVIDPDQIADWANHFATFTTEKALEGIFPKATPMRPVIVAGERDAKANTTLQEDLTVMMRIIEKTVGGRDDTKAKAMGIDIFAFARPALPRVFYIENHGALFVLNVRYPLLPPPTKDEQSQTNSATSSEWEKAREELYGRRRGGSEFRLHATANEEFDPERVDKLKQQLIEDLANATHIRGLKPDENVTIVVLGGPREVVTRREAHGRGHGGRGARAEVDVATTTDASAQSTLTLRARKSDIDALAKGKLKPEEFRKKTSAAIY
jgi:hypothetical protein